MGKIGTAVTIIFAAAALAAGCSGTVQTQPAVNESIDVIMDSGIVSGKTAGEISDLLADIDPMCTIVSVDTDGEQPDGGRNVYVTTDSGNRYCVNMSMSGEIANISDANTGRILYTQQDMFTDDEAAADKNVRALRGTGFSDEKLEEIARALDHAAPGEVIEDVTVEDQPAGKHLVITTESGREFTIVTEDDGTVVSTIEK